VLKEIRHLKRRINGFQMNYEDVGSGPAVLLIHGFPLDRTLWTYQIEALKRDYRLIVPDLRGHGQSQAPPGPYRMDQMADDLRALLQKLEIDRVVLAGLSMGGYVAFAFWRIYPHLVRALVLADTRAAADTPDARQNRYAMIDLVKDQGTAGSVESMLPNLLSPATLKSKPKIVIHARRMMVNTPTAGVIGALEGMARRPDSTQALETITVPTLIIVGEDDAITPPTEAEAMRDAILAARRQQHAPDVTLARIPDAGHLAPLENPRAVNQALQAFLSGLPD
jgi:pimeloyl-ACP methyl ester carboxylesterase